jgi:tetratricopeptide (TPR) repeat protein
MLYFARDYDSAIKQYRSALEMDHSFGTAHFWLGQVYEQKCMFDVAISEFQTGVQLTGGSTYSLARLAHGFAIAGSSDRCESLLRQLFEITSQKYVSPYDIATIYVGLGNYDNAFNWLNRAFEERSLWMGYLKVEPQMDPLRADSRFQDLLGRVGLITQS